MNNQAQAEPEVIRHAVRIINERWRTKQYDRKGAFLAEKATIAPTGFDPLAHGRSAYVQSYRDYDKAVTTLEFSAGDQEVDIIGDVVVAVCSSSAVYEMGGAPHREPGHNILVFSRGAGKWRVSWRTMQFTWEGENGD